MNNDHHLHAKEFYKAILTLETLEECEVFFSDICTIQELESFSQRLQVARLLLDGKNYALKDYHRMYVGKIVAAYEN